jgi:hypothetical protein
MSEFKNLKQNLFKDPEQFLVNVDEMIERFLISFE